MLGRLRLALQRLEHLRDEVGLADDRHEALLGREAGVLEGRLVLVLGHGGAQGLERLRHGVLVGRQTTHAGLPQEHQLGASLLEVPRHQAAQLLGQVGGVRHALAGGEAAHRHPEAPLDVAEALDRAAEAEENRVRVDGGLGGGRGVLVGTLRECGPE